MNIILLNVMECDFIVHSSYENKNAVLKVKYDEDYCKNLFFILKVIDFERLIHEVCIINNIGILANIKIFLNTN